MKKSLTRYVDCVIVGKALNQAITEEVQSDRRFMSATLENVAAKVNLSPSIVSRVLNGKQNARTSPETRRRIVECARELNYRPNLSARNLSKGKSHAIAFVCDLSTGLRVDSAVFEMCAEMLDDAGYKLNLRTFQDHPSALAAVGDMIASRSVDGLILWSSEPEMEDIGRLAEKHQFPFVIKGRFEFSHPNWLQVDFDHEAMSQDAVRFLVEKGRRNLGLICFDSTITHNVRHIEGYRRAIVEEGAAPGSVDRIFRYLEGRSKAENLKEFFCKNGASHDVPTLDGLVITECSATSFTEMTLMEMGVGIGFGPQDIAAAGAIHATASLLAGEAAGYEQFELTVLMDRLLNGQLLRILSGEKPEQEVVRYLPQLIPVRGLNAEYLQSFGKFAAKRFLSPID